MKKTLMCVSTVFVFFVAAAVAQTNANDTPSQGTQGTQSSSPSMSNQQPNASPDSAQGTNSTAAQGTMAGNMNSSEKKMKGCIQSEGGQYMLQTKKGKDVMLTGQDVSAHVGHEVTIHGMWAGGTSDMSNTSTGRASASGKSFNVTSVDMISDTCSMGKGKKSGTSGSMGSTTSNPSTPPPQ